VISEESVDHLLLKLSSSYGIMPFFICSFRGDVGDAKDSERFVSMLVPKFQDFPELHI
jgi:hypothetical protein